VGCLIAADSAYGRGPQLVPGEEDDLCTRTTSLLSVTTSRPSPFGEYIFLCVQLGSALVPFHHEVLLAETLTSAPVDVKSRCNLGYPFFQLKE